MTAPYFNGAKSEIMTCKMSIKRFLLILFSLCCAAILRADELPHLTPEAAFSGGFSDVRSVYVRANRLYDYVFEKAPDDWQVQSGKWGMMDQQNAAPNESWFGGRSEEIAALWNKRPFSGDFSVQFYFAFQEGVYGSGNAWAAHPADVALSFCADGKNLGSGYSLILGADGNRHHVLMKQGKVIAESLAPELLFSSAIDGRPAYRGFQGSFSKVTSSVTQEANLPAAKPDAKKEAAKTTSATTSMSANRGFGSAPRNIQTQIQTHWWYAQVNKIGNRIECWLDEKLLFIYEDEQPLNTGQFALWTFNNGLVLSRAKVFYESEIRQSFLKKSPKSEPIAAGLVSEAVIIGNGAP